MHRPLVHELEPRRDRRGAAVAVIILLVLAVSGLGLLTLRQGQQSIRHSSVSTDSQRALSAADSCAAGAIKVMPVLLDTYLMAMRHSATGDPPNIYPEQFDDSFFGDYPFGDAGRQASCVVRITEIADDAPAPGYSEGGGCFKRITMLASAELSASNATASTEMSQNLGSTQRNVIVRGLFGPINCQ